jgi:hypothetical protein
MIRSPLHALALSAALLAACKGAPKSGTANTDDASTTPLASGSAAPVASGPMNATPIPAATIAGFVNPAGLPPYAGPTGSIEGVVSITGAPSPEVPGQDFTKCPAAEKVYGKLFREGTAAPDGSRPVADVVVAVTGYSGFYVPERAEVRATTIEGCTFTERVIDLTVGQRLEVTSKASDLWAPTLEQMQLPALMVATPGGDPVKLYPRPGHYTLVDRMGHAWAKSDVWALLQPLHAVSGVDGHYRIDGVPLGKLTVSGRLTSIGQEASKPVEIVAGVVQKVDLALTYSASKMPVKAPSRVDAGRAPVLK